MNYLTFCKHISIFILVNHHLAVESTDDNGETIENSTNSEASFLENSVNSIFDTIFELGSTDESLETMPVNHNSTVNSNNNSGEKIENSTNSEASFSENSNKNIFDTIFNLGSTDDLLDVLDDDDIKINTRDLANFTVNHTTSEQIIYYNISATPLNKFNDEYHFEYNHFGDYAETKIFHVSNVVKIDGLIQVKQANVTSVSIDPFGNFTILFRCPKFVRTTRQTDTSYGIQQSAPYIKVELENSLNYYSSVIRGLKYNFENMQFALFPQLLPQLVTRKIRKFENAFPFLSDYFSTRLNSTYNVDDTIILKIKQYYYSFGELGPVVITGLENMTNIKIAMYRQNLYTPTLKRMLWYRMIVTTGPLNFQYKWGDDNSKISSISSLTLSIPPTSEPDRFEYNYQDHIGKVTDQNNHLFDYSSHLALKFNYNNTYFSNLNLLQALEYYLLEWLESEYQLIENPLSIIKK